MVPVSLEVDTKYSAIVKETLPEIIHVSIMD